MEFVSIRDALDGREMCTRSSAINKITPTGKDRVHPNASGQTLIADTVREALDDLYAEGAISAAVSAVAPWRECADLTFEAQSDYWLRDVGKGEIDFARIFSALRDPSEHIYHVEHDDAPDDETASLPPGSPRGTPLPVKPRNPAGSANTAWTSRKYPRRARDPRTPRALTPCTRLAPRQRRESRGPAWKVTFRLAAAAQITRARRRQE